ncbi:hypothetical protein RB653_009361 [Dictyostelium firmibasis]|uniref:Uncharacterized protein n=1 Tax=Dictyostelium firmibasis TaxID=79012 RepID=A0AAN7YTQ2_9MYCE
MKKKSNNCKKAAHCQVETKSRNIRKKFLQKINKRLPLILNSIKKDEQNQSNKELTVEMILSKSLSYLNEIDKILSNQSNHLSFSNDIIINLKNTIKNKEEII